MTLIRKSQQENVTLQRSRGVYPVGLAVIALCFAFLPLLEADPFAAKGRTLSHCKGRHEGQTIYGSRGCAVRYEVPDPAKTWYAKEIRIFGESYGAIDSKETRFYISFIDMEGNVYGTSDHLVGDYFSESPVWVKVKITPVQLPPAFWVVVDFKPSRAKGVYIGYIKEGGHSKLCDSEFNLYEVTEGFDFSIETLVNDEVKGKRVDYDPSTFTKKADTDKASVVGMKTAESERVTVEYVSLDDVWGQALLKLSDTALGGYGERFGLESETPIKITVRVDGNSETSAVHTKQQGLVEWVIKTKTDLLPCSRGGQYAHIFTICRELVRELIRQRLIRSEFAPDGLVDGFSTYLAGCGVHYVYKACGRELWPVPFSYQMEEGPPFVESWIQEEPKTPGRRYAAVLKDVQAKVGDQRLEALIKKVFAEKIPARDVVKKLWETLEEAGETEGLDAFFPTEMVNPPMVWTFKQPDFKNYGIFAGMKVRRYKTQAYAQYDDNSCERALMLEEEEHAIYFTPPPGTWRIGNLKVFCIRKGEEEEGKLMRIKIQDAQLEVLGEVEVPYKHLNFRKLRWQSIGAIQDIKVSAPFYLVFDTGSSGGSGIEIGLDEGGIKSHSARIMPGSHVAAVSENGDWMVRVYFDPEKPMEKKPMDEAINTLRKKIKAAAGGR